MQVKTEALIGQTAKVVKAVKNNAVIEAYSFIRLHSKEGRMRISASSTDLQIEAFINETEAEDFTVAVNGAMFFNIISRAPGSYTNISISENTMVISSGGMNVKLPIANEKLMSLKPVDNVKASIRVDTLKLFAEQCQHALDNSNNEMRFESFHVEVGKNGLRVTALDGKRVAVRNTLETEVERDIVCLGKPLNEAVKVLTGTVFIDIPEQDNYIILRGDSEICTVSTLSMEYFAIDKILGTRNDIKNIVRASKSELLAALEVIKLVSDKMSIELQESGVELNAVDTTGDATMFVPAKVQGKIDLACNVRYLYEALKSLPDDEIEIGIINDLSPIFICGYGNKIATEVVLPVRKK